MDIPVAAPPAEEIAKTNMTGTKTSWSWTTASRSLRTGWETGFETAGTRAGLPKCSAHGLRKAFLRPMAEAGCSEDFIASISGHKAMGHTALHRLRCIISRSLSPTTASHADAA
jgi:integrase